MEKKLSFSEFPSVSKAEWIAKATKDLRGKPFEDLIWSIEENIQVAPFYHPEEFEDFPPSVNQDKMDNSWWIGEKIVVAGDLEAVNQKVLSALNGGANFLELEFHFTPDEQQIAQLLKGVETSYIEFFLTTDRNVDLLQIFQRLQSFGENHKKEIRGAMNYDPLKAETSLDSLKALFSQIGTTKVKFMQLKQSGKDYSDQLAHLIYRGNRYLYLLQEEGIAPDQVNQSLVFELEIGDHFLPEVAKIRSLRKLWTTILDAYGVKGRCNIMVRTLINQDAEEVNNNMIRAGSQALSAVIGGTDYLIVTPSDAMTDPTGTEFSRQVARNVQHILQMESYLDRVIDPAAGSYYIEQMTDALSQKAWQKFLDLEYGGNDKS